MTSKLSNFTLLPSSSPPLPPPDSAEVSLPEATCGRRATSSRRAGSQLCPSSVPPSARHTKRNFFLSGQFAAPQVPPQVLPLVETEARKHSNASEREFENRRVSSPPPFPLTHLPSPPPPIFVLRGTQSCGDFRLIRINVCVLTSLPRAHEVLSRRWIREGGGEDGREEGGGF